MGITIFLVIAVTLNIIIVAIVLSWAMKKTREQRERALSNIASPTSKSFRGQENGSGISNGISYRYQYFPGAKNSPPYVKISIDAPSSGAFQTAKESSFDKFFEGIGICSEIKTGDAYFDDNFYINTDYVEFGEDFFSSQKKRDAVRELYELTFTKVEHDGKEMAAKCVPFKKEMTIDEALVDKVVARLKTLSEDMPKGHYTAEGNRSWRWMKVIVQGIPIFLGIIGLVGFVMGMEKYPPLRVGAFFVDSLKYSFPLLVLFIWSIILIIKGRSDSHRVLLAVFFSSLITFPLGIFGLGTYYNGYYDDSPSTVHHAVLVDKYYKSTKGGRNYYARLKSWHPERSTEKIEINSHEYDVSQEGRTIFIVETKSGKLGFEWLVGYWVK
jgi:hypothetical protein